MMLCVFLIASLLPTLIKSGTYALQTCTTNQILDTTTLQCKQCPNDLRVNYNQEIPTSCICPQYSYQTGLNTCSLSATGCSGSSYAPILNTDGSFISTSSLGSLVCLPCAINAYPNQNGTACTSCLRNMKYSATQNICICAANGYTLSQRGCFTNTQIAASSNFGQQNSKFYNRLKYLFPSCAYFGDILSCSQIINLCTYSMAYTPDSSQPQCKFIQSSTINSYHYLNTDSDQFYMSPNTFKKNQQLNFKLLMYLPTGNLAKEKIMKLTDLMRCGLPTDNSVSIKIGNNIQVGCTFDFDNLAAKLKTKTYQNYFYQLYLRGVNNNYFPVYVYLSGSKKPIKRFFFEDTLTSKTFMNVANKLKFSITLNSSGYLVFPKLQIGYKQLSHLDGKITPTGDKDQQITFTIKFSYSLTTFWAPFIGIFVTINVLVLIQTLARTYVAYLNRQSLLGFFFYLGNFWSLWMFYFLLVISGYWFLFCKTTQDLYIFVPDSDSDFFYVVFYVIAGLMGLLRLIVVLYDKRDKLSYQVFLINWQKGKNSWRQIFIVNSLAEFYTHRTISFFWMLLVLLFFMVGLNWEDNAAQVTHTNISEVYFFNPRNRIFLYFMGCTVLLVIGIIFKILRRLSVIKWPYPFQDFVDYCNVTSISFFFMKKRSSQAYYIHACLPDKTQVTYKQINDAIRKGQNKMRNIMREHSFQDQQRMYIIYTGQQLEDRFTNMIKRNQQQQHQNLIKLSTKNIQRRKLKSISYRQDFVENKLKPYLRDVQRERPTRTRSFIKRLFGVPQVDLRQQRRRNQAIFDQNDDLVEQLFPNGNQFQQIHTLIIIFLMLILATANVAVSTFLTYFIDHYLINGWIERSCRKGLEKMTKVKEGFML